MSAILAPDDIVRTRGQGSANAREPLLVLDPLLEFLAARGLAAPEGSTPRRSAKGIRT